jgi:predicted alpha/beta superfamily hydrolase
MMMRFMAAAPTYGVDLLPLIPFVDRTCRTMPTDRGPLDHSYGGLFAIYSLEQRLRVH